MCSGARYFRLSPNDLRIFAHSSRASSRMTLPRWSGDLRLVRIQKYVEMPVLKNSWSGRPTMPSSQSFSRIHCRMRDSPDSAAPVRSEEHTSELQSRENLVCRLLLEKKN